MEKSITISKFDYIDSLRGIAILAVVMIHTAQWGTHIVPPIMGRIISEGARGVQLFYLASAFTLFLSFKRRFAKENKPIRNFFIRRFFRIAPMYYLGIIYFLWQYGFGSRNWLGGEENITVLNILSNVLFLHGFNPQWINSLVPGGWSIGVEMTFYALLPILFHKIKNLNQAFYFFIFTLLFRFVLQFVLHKLHVIPSKELWDYYLFLYFPSQLPIFSLGVIMYFVVIESASWTNISGKAVLLLSGMVLFQLLTGKLFFPNHILFGIGFLFLGIGLSRYNFKLMVNPIVDYIGRISFSMYLVHFAVLYWLNQLSFIDYSANGPLNYIIRYCLVVMITILISTFFYRVIEVPFQNIGKNIINKLDVKKNQD